MKNTYFLEYTSKGIYVRCIQTKKRMNNNPYPYSQRHLAEKYKYKLDCIESDRIINNLKK